MILRRWMRELGPREEPTERDIATCPFPPTPVHPRHSAATTSPCLFPTIKSNTRARDTVNGTLSRSRNTCRDSCLLRAAFAFTPSPAAPSSPIVAGAALRWFSPIGYASTVDCKTRSNDVVPVCHSSGPHVKCLLWRV